MPAVAYYRDDTLESLIRKCIVFPADGSETRLVHMIARTVTQDDPTNLCSYNRCVEMATTFGGDFRKVRVMAHRTGQDVQSTYLFFYNLSPNLPINLTIARVIGVTPSHLKNKKYLFWRGDVVAMKVQPKSEQIHFLVQCLDADLFELGPLEEFLRETYLKGVFGLLLHNMECECEHGCEQVSTVLNKACRGFISLTLPWSYFAVIWRLELILGSKYSKSRR